MSQRMDRQEMRAATSAARIASAMAGLMSFAGSVQAQALWNLTPCSWLQVRYRRLRHQSV